MREWEREVFSCQRGKKQIVSESICQYLHCWVSLFALSEELIIYSLFHFQEKVQNIIVGNEVVDPVVTDLVSAVSFWCTFIMIQYTIGFQRVVLQSLWICASTIYLVFHELSRHAEPLLIYQVTKFLVLSGTIMYIQFKYHSSVNGN